MKALRARLIEQELKYLDLTNFVNELASDNLALQRSIGIENEVESPLIVSEFPSIYMHVNT